MFRRGIDLKRIVVIPDEMDVRASQLLSAQLRPGTDLLCCDDTQQAITSTVKELSDLVGPNGYVFTTGGIGPTHDDITYEGVVRILLYRVSSLVSFVY